MLPDALKPHAAPVAGADSSTARAPTRRALLALGATLVLAGCGSQSFQRGFVMPEGALQQIPVGSSQEQVLVVLGTPSTVATIDGEVFYYISQRAERQFTYQPPKVVDQRVLAIYFDRQKRVQRIADYGLQDGKIFDFVSRTTPTGGADRGFLQQIFSIIGS